MKKALDLVNEIISVAEVGTHAFVGERPGVTFGFGSDSISFLGYERYSKFRTSVDALFELHKDVASSFSLKSFQNYLIGLLYTPILESKTLSQNEIKDFFDMLLANPVQEYEVINELFGATVDVDQMSLGDFSIYNLELSKGNLLQRYPSLRSEQIDHLHGICTELLIGVKVMAREQAKAFEVARERLRIFDNIISYVMGDLSRTYSVVGFGSHQRQVRHEIILKSDGVGSRNYETGRFEKPNLRMPYFVDPKLGHDKVWFLITKTPKCEIEKRMLTAAEWIGKALRENDPPNSLFQFIVAIESMLQYDQKAFVNQSIASQLSESLAFILEESKDKRLEVADQVRDLYGKRSAIAHGDRKVIDKEDLKLARTLSKRMVEKFLTTEPYASFKTMEQLRNHLTDLKFT